MSPEQARGEVDAIDERSDVYCATALFFELVTLRHYLGEPENLQQVLHAIQNEDARVTFSTTSHPTQGAAPAEFIHFVKKGLRRDPGARYQSVTEMIDLLEAALDGRVKVQCPFTLQKRVMRELGRLSDRHPVMVMAGLLSGSLGFVGTLAWTFARAMH